MKATRIINYTTVLLIILLFGSCTDVLDLQSDSMEPRLVITGTLSTVPGYQVIEISATVPYFGQELPSNIDADRVCINGQELAHDAPGIYALGDQFAAVEGETYKLEVWIDFDKDGVQEYYSASTTVPVLHKLETLLLESVLPSSVKDIPFVLILGFQDTTGPHYYGASLSINDVVYSNRILRYYVHTLNSYSQDGKYVYFPVSDWIITDALTWDNGQTFDLYVGDTLTVELQTLSKEYYEYLLEAKTEKSQQFPLFSGPRGNVSGNISGGALGLFGSYAASRKTVILPECPGLPVR